MKHVLVCLYLGNILNELKKLLNSVSSEELWRSRRVL